MIRGLSKAQEPEQKRVGVYQLRICPQGQPTSDHEVGYFDDQPPRIPMIGEQITGPDDFGSFWVHDVIYDYEGGFAAPPHVMVVARWNHPKNAGTLRGVG